MSLPRLYLKGHSTGEEGYLEGLKEPGARHPLPRRPGSEAGGVVGS